MNVESDKKYFALLFIILFPLYLTWTFDHSLWNPDETRDAGIAREMWVTRDFAVPRLNGEPFLEKPPLYYWSCSAVYAITGRLTDGLTRLPAALYGFLGALFTFLIGRRLHGARVGFTAAAIIATTAQYFRMSHFALMDSSLAALLAGALYFYLAENIFLFLLLTTLAFFTKGFVAVALAGVVIGTDLLLQRKFKRLTAITAIGMIVFALLTGPWFYALWKAGGTEHLRAFLVDNTLNRFAGRAKIDHREPFYFYFGSFPADFLPWTFVLAAAAWAAYKRRFTADRFLVVWFAAMFVLLSISSSKRSMYLLPLFPAAAVITAAWLDQQAAGLKTFKSIFAVMCAAIVVGDVFFVKRLDRDKSFLPIVHEIEQRRGDAELIGFDLSEMESGVFPFYLQRNVRNIRSAEVLHVYLTSNPDKKVLLLANRNKQKDLDPVLAGRMDLVYTFRPDRKTRSYLLYQKS